MSFQFEAKKKPVYDTPTVFSSKMSPGVSLNPHQNDEHNLNVNYGRLLRLRGFFVTEA